MRGLLALAVERGGHQVLQAGSVDEADAALDAAGAVDVLKERRVRRRALSSW